MKSLVQYFFPAIFEQNLLTKIISNIFNKIVGTLYCLIGCCSYLFSTVVKF